MDQVDELFDWLINSAIVPVLVQIPVTFFAYSRFFQGLPDLITQ